MAHDQAAPSAGKLVVRNIGLALSGDLANPILDADTLVCEGGRITAIGASADCDTEGADTVIDARGAAVAPGLIDSHSHPVFGDWTPRQNQIGWIDSMVHGGVTTLVSVGEVHLPGRPRDVIGAKALAITAQRAFSAFHPSGMKVHAGAVVVERGMSEADFAELAAIGVDRIAEIGLGTVKEADEARQAVAWARKYGMRTIIHTGGPSIPGSGMIDKDVVLASDADVIGHINGGHTALPPAQIRELIERSSRAIEIVHNGNEKMAVFAARTAAEMGYLDRVILGTDSPAGSGVQPLGILRVISLLAGLADIPPEVAICFATGNTARVQRLDGGRLEAGRAADLVFLARAQCSSGAHLLSSIAAGDLPGVGMVVIDGVVRCGRSRNTPPAEVVPEVVQAQAHH